MYLKIVFFIVLLSVTVVQAGEHKTHTIYVAPRSLPQVRTPSFFERVIAKYSPRNRCGIDTPGEACVCCLVAVLIVAGVSLAAYMYTHDPA